MIEVPRSEGVGQAEWKPQSRPSVHQPAKVQAQIIEDLLDMSRIISGNVRLDATTVVDVTQVVEAAIETVRPAAEAKSIRLEAVLGPNAGLVLGDSGRLQQVVWNLLTNAIKFTPKGGRVQTTLQRVNSRLQLRIQDTRQVIKAEFLPYVFDRFRQADPGTNRRFGGLGLGLSIVKHLVELHGGSVEAQSSGEGQGATFIVDLPIRTLHDEKADDELSLADRTTLRGIRVLVVDDEPDARDLISCYLQQYVAKVHVASSVTEALGVFRRERPDALLSDIGMPEQEGYELIRAVRSLSAEEGGSTPAVALTALARAEDRKVALLAGYQAHVTKPVDLGELVAVVATLTGRTGR